MRGVHVHPYARVKAQTETVDCRQRGGIAMFGSKIGSGSGPRVQTCRQGRKRRAEIIFNQQCVMERSKGCCGACHSRPRHHPSPLGTSFFFSLSLPLSGVVWCGVVQSRPARVGSPRAKKFRCSLYRTVSSYRAGRVRAWT